MGTSEIIDPQSVPRPPKYEKNQYRQNGAILTSFEREFISDHFSYRNIGKIFIGSKVIDLKLPDRTCLNGYFLALPFF